MSRERRARRQERRRRANASGLVALGPASRKLRPYGVTYAEMVAWAQAGLLPVFFEDGSAVDPSILEIRYLPALFVRRQAHSALPAYVREIRTAYSVYERITAPKKETLGGPAPKWQPNAWAVVPSSQRFQPQSYPAFQNNHGNVKVKR